MNPHPSDHAVERYTERVRPGATKEVALADIRRLIAFGTVTDTPPEWVTPADYYPDARYIVVGNVVFPSLDNTITTCIVRSTRYSLHETLARHHGRAVA